VAAAPTAAAVTRESRPRAIGGVRAAVVLRQDLDVLIAVAAFELVLDPEVRKVHAVIEVRQVVLTSPFFDLMRVPIRTPVTVRPTAIVFLEKALVLALEVLLEDHAVYLRTLLAESLLSAEVGAIQGRVVRQLTRPTDACMERLVTDIAAVAPVRVEEVASTRSQGDGVLASVERHGPNQPFVSQVTQTVIAGLRRHIPWIAQVPLRHDPEGTRCGERAALLAIDFVAVIAVQDDLPFEAARQLKAVQEYITRVVITFARIVIACSIASIVITVAGVVFRLTVGCRTASKLDPMDLDVARFVIAIPRVVPSRIGAARHRCLLLMDRAVVRRGHARVR
jgi:hypothetical protein